MNSTSGMSHSSMNSQIEYRITLVPVILYSSLSVHRMSLLIGMRITWIISDRSDPVMDHWIVFVTGLLFRIIEVTDCKSDYYCELISIEACTI